MRAIAMTDYESGVALQELPAPRPACSVPEKADEGVGRGPRGPPHLMYVATHSSATARALIECARSSAVKPAGVIRAVRAIARRWSQSLFQFRSSDQWARMTRAIIRRALFPSSRNCAAAPRPRTSDTACHP